jgi:C4-type Zn-finger protein
MLLTREIIQPFEKEVWEQPNPCPSCGRTMQLSRSTGGIPEIRSYGCAECGLWIIEERRQTDVAEGRPRWDCIPM